MNTTAEQHLSARNDVFSRMTARSKRVLELSLREALSLGHNYIGTEHILLGILRENEGIAARVLADMDVTASEVRSEVARIARTPGKYETASLPALLRKAADALEAA